MYVNKPKVVFLLNLKHPDIPRAVIVLIVGGFIQSVGNSLMWPLNSLFMHTVLGRTLTEAGILLAVQSAVSLLGQFISGFLADRFGPKRIMIIGLVGAVLSVGAIGIFPVWRVYVPAFILFGLAQAFIFVPLYALTHAVWPEGGRRGFNLLYVSTNAGVAVGTAIGGLIAQVSFRLIFSLNAIAFLIYLLLVIIGVSERIAPIHLIPPTQQTQRLTKDKGFKVLLALGGGIFFVWGAYIQLVNITRSYEPTWFFLGFIQCAMDPKWHFCRNLTVSTHLGDHGVGTVFQTAILSWRRSPRHRLCNLTWKTSLRVLYCCHAHSNVRGNAYFASRSRSCR